MSKFICVADEKEIINAKGENVGITPKRALFYCSSLGKKRIYRQSLNSPTKSMKIFEYKNSKKAQALCDEINEAYNDNFKVEEVKDETV